MRFDLSPKKNGGWRKWYAWYPVETRDKQLVWLETVYRKWDANTNLVLIDQCDPGYYHGSWIYECINL